MIRFLLNKILKARGVYYTQDSKIYRKLTWGLVYCVKVCSSPEQAKRIVNQLNQLK